MNTIKGDFEKFSIGEKVTFQVIGGGITDPTVDRTYTNYGD